MSAPILLPVGSVTLKVPPAFVSPQCVRPPTSFDASAIDTSVTVGHRWGFHPVNLSDCNQPLALKIMDPNPLGDVFEDEMPLKPGQKLMVYERGGIIHLVPKVPLRQLRGRLKGLDVAWDKLRDKSDRFE